MSISISLLINLILITLFIIVWVISKNGLKIVEHIYTYLYVIDKKISLFLSKKDFFYNNYKFNLDRDNLNKFDKELTFNLLLEEVLELMIKDKTYIYEIKKDLLHRISQIPKEYLTNDDREILDSLYDIEVVADGAQCQKIIELNKGIDYDTMREIIDEGKRRVNEYNNSKGVEKDENGKIIKSKDIEAPFIPLYFKELVKTDK